MRFRLRVEPTNSSDWHWSWEYADAASPIRRGIGTAKSKHEAKADALDDAKEWKRQADMNDAETWEVDL